ncbi:MAG: amidase [Ilumatobacter sp.]|uniref:amidase n=1 Tax=Ilumatobacter sp. TaxID=1967498 RepID=UPI002630A84C|nr:amidase [Ilumatobacter sp.]MDJ0770539.1 amidase [Ilumatobacter sp.]
MSELWQLGALELAAKIRSGEVSCRAVMEAHLARTDDVNPHLNAVVRRLDDEALAAADAADAALAHDEAVGPLHGVPCTVKENIDVAGTPTTQGIPALAEAVAPVDAPTVQRMRAAGAIPFARTNLPDLGLRVHTRSTLHGLTRNPWHPGVTAGGSSGGEASAIAAGISPIGLGNDIGGSLRNPAHCCGIASIKPTVGVVPMATVVPPEDLMLAAQQMLCEGPMARLVADVRAGFEAVAGWSERDPRSVPARLTDLERDERITVAVMADPPGGETHPEIAAAVKHAADHLADQGHHVVEAAPPDFEETSMLWAMLLIADINAQRPLLDLVMSEEARGIIDALIAQYPEPTMQSSCDLQAARFKLMRDWSSFFVEHPILLSPTWAFPAFEHDADTNDDDVRTILGDTLRPVLPGNVLGIPGVVVPCGMAAGLPVGVQVIGDKYTDLRCLTIAEQIQQAEGVHTPIDPVTA